MSPKGKMGELWKMSRSATELHTLACCHLNEEAKWAAAMLLRRCVLDYEEKNDTAYITITAPPDSYKFFAFLDNSICMTCWITPEKLEGDISDLPEDFIILRSIYRTFALLVLDPIEGTPATIQFSIKEASETTELQPPKTDNTPETPVHNQGRQIGKGKSVNTWENLRFRSNTEIRIAKELDRRKVLFFPNCMARLGFKERENREPDFLVCYEGKWGILEVDGPDTHPPSRAAEDHERDRLFKQHGILLIEHFDASECWENADGVVKKFLELLKRIK
jgi:hypothetical protein